MKETILMKQYSICIPLFFLVNRLSTLKFYLYPKILSICKILPSKWKKGVLILISKTQNKIERWYLLVFCLTLSINNMSQKVYFSESLFIDSYILIICKIQYFGREILGHIWIVQHLLLVLHSGFTHDKLKKSILSAILSLSSLSVILFINFNIMR